MDSPLESGESKALLKLWFELLPFRTGRINFCYFKPTSLFIVLCSSRPRRRIQGPYVFCIPHKRCSSGQTFMNQLVTRMFNEQATHSTANSIHRLQAWNYRGVHPVIKEAVNFPCQKYQDIYAFLNSQKAKCEIKFISLHIESLRIINNIINHLRFDGAKLLHGCCSAVVLNPLQDQAHDVDAKIKIEQKIHLVQLCKSGKIQANC